MEGDYQFTYKYFDEVDTEIHSASFTVTVIDNPCVPGLHSENNANYPLSVVLGQPEIIDLDYYSDGDCEFELDIVERDCATMPMINNGAILTDPILSFTQAAFVPKTTYLNELRVVHL